MPPSRRLEIGRQVLYDGIVYSVEGLEGLTVRLRSSKGKASVVSTRELVAASDFEVLDGDEQGGGEELDTAQLDNVPPEALRKARELRVHLDEAITGYPSGDPAAPDQPEPKLEYDPTLTTVKQRLRAKATEIGVSDSTLWKLKEAADLLRNHAPKDIGTERLGRILDAIEAPYDTRTQRMMRRTLDEHEGTRERVAAVIALVDDLGLQPPPPVEPLPEIDQQDVNLVTWLALVPG